MSSNSLNATSSKEGQLITDIKMHPQFIETILSERKVVFFLPRQWLTKPEPLAAGIIQVLFTELKVG